MARRNYNSDYNSNKGMYSKAEYERKNSQAGSNGYSKADFIRRYNSGYYDERRKQIAEEEEVSRQEAEQRRQQEEYKRYGQALDQWMDEQRAIDSQADIAARRLGTKTGSVKEILSTRPVTEMTQAIYDRKKPYDISKLPSQEEQEKKSPSVLLNPEDAMKNWAVKEIINGAQKDLASAGYEGFRQEKENYGDSGVQFMTAKQLREFNKFRRSLQKEGRLDMGNDQRFVSDEGLQKWIDNRKAEAETAAEKAEKIKTEYENSRPSNSWQGVLELVEKKEGLNRPAGYDRYTQQEYDEALYDSVYGKGKYSDRIDALETDEDAAALDDELSAMWDRLTPEEISKFDGGESLKNREAAEERRKETTARANEFFRMGYDNDLWAEDTTPEEKREALFDYMMGGTAGRGAYADLVSSMTPEEKAELDSRLDEVYSSANAANTNTWADHEKEYNENMIRSEAYKKAAESGEKEQGFRDELKNYTKQAEELKEQGYTGQYKPELVPENKWIVDEEDTEGRVYNVDLRSEVDKAYQIINTPDSMDPDRNMLDTISKYEFLSDDPENNQVEQFNIFYEYDKQHGTNKAGEFLKGLDSYLQSMVTEYQDMYAREASRDWRGIFHRAASYPAKVFTGLIGTAGTFAALMGNESAKDPNSGWYAGDKFFNVLRDQQNEDIDKALGGNGTGKFLLSVIDSIGDNLIAVGTGKVLAPGDMERSMRLVQAIMSGSATSGRMAEMLQKGASPTEAALYAIGNGAIEWITEKYSLEELLKPDVKAMLGNKKQLAGFIAKNIAAEGSEEMASDLLNIALDSVLSIAYGHETELMEQYRQLVADGMSPTEATSTVLGQMMQDIGMSGLAGGLSGGFMSGGRIALNSISQRSEGRNIRQNKSMNQLLELAAGMKEGTQSRQMAEEMIEKKHAGTKPTNVQMGKLAQLMVLESNEQTQEVARTTLERQINEELKEKNVENAGEYSRIITDSLMNDGKMDVMDRMKLAKSKTAIEVWTAYNTADSLENMRAQVEIAQKASGQRSIINQVSELTADKAKAAGVLANEINRSLKETGSMAEAIDNLQERRSGLLSEKYANLAKELLESDKNAKNSRTYLEDAMKIRMAAMTLSDTMPKTNLETETAQKLFDAARNEFEEIDAQRIKNQAKVVPGQGVATFDGAQYGTDAWTKKLDGLTQDQRYQMKTLAEITVRMGNRLNIINDTKHTDVYGFEDDSGTVTINVAGLNRGGLQHHMLVTMSHELTHWLEQNSAEGYKQLRSFVLSSLRSKGQNIEQLIADTIDNQNAVLGAESGNDLDINGAMAEIVAKSCENLLSSKAIEAELAKTNPELHSRIRNFVKKFVARLRNAVRGMSGSLSKEARALYNETEKIAEIWLGARQEALNRDTVTNAKEEGSGISYSIVDKNGNVYTLTQDQINENKTKVSAMKQVSNINENRFAKDPNADFKTRATKYVNSIGNKAVNDVFGEVTIDVKGIEHLIDNLTSRRAGMLPAVKDVIEKGAIVDIAEKGQHHQFDSAVIAAPVIYIDDTYYMGVVIKQNKTGNSYYMHDAVIAMRKDGSLPVIKSLLNQATGSDPSIANILLTIPEYNGNSGKVNYSIAEREESNKKGSITVAAGRQVSASTSETTDGLTSKDILTQDEDAVKMAREEEMDKEYLQAIHDGDEQKQLRMIREKFNNTEGIYPFYAPARYAGEHINITKAIKEGDMKAIKKAAKAMAKYVPDNAVLVPMPSHTGVAEDGSGVVLLTEELSRITGAPVIKALEGDNRESRYESKKTNKKGITAEKMGFRQVKGIPSGSVPMIVDNVVSVGETAKAALDAIKGASVLSYTKGMAESVVPGLKAAYPTTDKQGNTIPLSKKGDINNPNWRYSVMQSPDMEVNNFMMGLQEFNLTAQERTMLRQYKGLRFTAELTEMKIRENEKALRKLQEKAKKEKLSVYDRDEMTKLNNRLGIERDRLAKVRREQVRATMEGGYAREMMKQDSLMKNLVNGVTADQLISLVSDMSRQLDELNRDMQERAAQLKELGQSSAVLQIRQQFSQNGLKRIAAQLKADMNSDLQNKEIENRLALIALKMKEGKFDAGTAEELTDMILGKMRGGYDSYVLSTLRGRKIALSPAQLKELKANHSGIREINAELAGTGIKVVASGGTNLEHIWGELSNEITSLDPDTNPLEQLNSLMNVIRSERNTIFAERFSNEAVQAASEAVLKAAAELVPEIVTDEKSMKMIRETLKYVQEISGQAEQAAGEISDMTSVIDRIKKTGQKAASGANKLTGDIGTAIRYFDSLSEQSEAAMWKTERLKLIDQLKSENTQNLLAEQEKWRQKIEKDKSAREKMESNLRLRKKINTNVDRVRKLLINETDIRNIPEHMKGLAREMLGRVVDNDLIGRKITGIERQDLMEIRRVLDAMEKIDGGFAVEDLRMMGDEEAQATVLDALADLEDGIGFYNNKPGKDLMANLQGFHNALNRISDAVSTITSVINAERSLSFLDRRMDLADAAEDIRRDMNNSRFKGELAGRGAKTVNMAKSAVFYGNMTPVYFFKTLRNNGLDMVWKDIQQGENRSGLETQKAKAYLEGLAEKTGYKEWADQKHEIVLGGQKMTVSIENMMELYAIWKREQNTNPEMSQHLSKGGVYIQEEADDKGLLRHEQKEQKAVRVTDGEIADIYSKMTDAQKEYLEGIVRYLSNDMSELGNEASMRMYGIKKYKESYYFPMKVWDGVKSARSDRGITGTDENRAAHRSWSKRRMHMAQNALVIGNFTQDAVNHIVEMINYNTMAPGIENMNKILNFQFTEGETEDNMTKRNLRVMFEKAYGREALRYLETFMKDMNGGVTQDQRKTLRDKALTMFKKNAVAGSLSVALQQPLSYIRAAMLISPKYLTMGLSPAYWKGSYQEMMQHSGVAVIKDMGRFDMNFGQSAKDFITPEKKGNLYEKVSDVLTAAPEMMDRMTWTRMWSAVKAEQKAQHPEMDVTSDKFLDMVGVRFNQLMRETQVYDSILVKSSNMRSQNLGMKLITSFMAEPTLSLNVLADAVGKVRAGDKGSIGHMAKAAATFLLSAVMQAAVKGAMGTGRTPDDKKTWLENFLNKLQYNLMNEANPASLIPGYSDIIELLKKGELKDDAMGALGKLVSVWDTAQKAFTGEGKGLYRDIEDTAGQLAQLFTNIPAKNLMRDMRAMRNWIVGDTYANRPSSAAVMKWQAIDNLVTADNLLGTINTKLKEAGFSTSNKAYYQRLYEAQKNKNTGVADELHEYLTLGKGVKEDTITTNLRTLTKKDDSMTPSQKIKALRESGMEDSDIAKWITTEFKEGRLKKEEAEKLYQEANPAKTKDDAYFHFEQVQWEKNTGKDAGTSDFFRLDDALNSGKAEDVKKAVKELKEHGYKDEKILDHVNSRIMKQYKEGTLNRKQAEEALKKYGGMKEGDVWWKIDRADYQKETGAESVSGYYYRLTDAVNANKAEKITKAVKDLLGHGITKEKIKNKLSDWKKEYLAADSAGRIRIRDAITKAYKAAGYTADDAGKTIDNWMKESKKKKN